MASPALAPLWMVLSCLCFGLVGAVVKLASAQYSFFELAAYRGLIGMLIVGSIVWRGRHAGKTLATTMPWGHLWRGVFGMTSLLLWFYSLTGLPLATAMTLAYTAPIFQAGIVAWLAWRGSHVFDPKLAAAIGLSFVGMSLLLKPTIGAQQWVYGIAGVSGGMIAAAVYQQVQRLGRAGEPEYRIVFYFSLAGLVIGTLGTLAHTGFHGHDARGLAMLLAIGVLASIGQLLMTRAYTVGRTLVIANLQYSGVIISTALGYGLFGERLDGWGWAGAAIIVASGVTAISLGRAPETPPPQTEASPAPPLEPK
jgi:S-adenosylmethionine uptake transporter